MKIPFYLLGLLIRYGPQHGYKLKQIIEERISDFAKIKLPTIYYHLQKLKEQGYIEEAIDKEGNRPEKLVYTITESGIKYFDHLYINQLHENYTPEFALDGVLFYREKVDQEVLLEELKRKKEAIVEKLNSMQLHKENTLNHVHELGRVSTSLIFEHHQCHYEAELRWLEKAIKGLHE